MAVQVEFLKSVAYFSGLSPAELDSIKQVIFEKTVERGEIILLEGEPAEALFFVVSGAVKVFKTSAEGKEQILNVVRPGESFNDAPIFDDAPNPASAQAMAPLILYGIKKSELRIILRGHPPIALNVIKVLAERVRQLVSLVEDLSFRHVIGRVARILLEHAGDGAGARPRLTQQEMAAMAGTAREVVGRSLKALEEEGAIRLERHRIIITNQEALKAIVATSY
ncbi:MAG: Crp/Fnr family transcriptional regulator [Chloroflexi bacterium]|nr:Crp/Fnr family transcriptional regulator [Chloroflexota bacterium]